MPLAAALMSMGFLWGAYLFARFTGRASQRKIADQFDAFVRKGETGAWIGGHYWHMDDGECWPAIGLTGATREERLQKEMSNRLILPIVGFLSPLLLLVKSGDVAGQEGFNTLMVFVALAISVTNTAWEFAFRQGWQFVWGAMVLDPTYQRRGADEVDRQRAHGDARLASADETRAAAAQAKSKRSGIHDQEF